ncbi:hypothetical protein CTAYLR_006613 [Chrysophaeum taylorii]|uniref:3-methyladenine DNA glycosylase n=1 Tax=Chrysophaeum taylorii TaxID=2483200 RepID=A0AAD7ULR1_9STRA|nr:hypothetical protein CTAYLR_006613 [Chrysophaeum taylorii]
MRVSAVVSLKEHVWRSRAAAHAERVREVLGGMSPLEAAGARENPITNFVFTYYWGFKPGDLTRWSPGAGVELEVEDVAASMRLLSRGKWRRTESGAVAVDFAGRFDDLNMDAIRHAYKTLVATSRRAPVWNCYGLHEWAMLYGDRPSSRFQKAMPFRVSPATIAAVVEAPGALRCTHFDAYRFFAPSAQPLNEHPGLSRESQPSHEQPGCVHAGMDLFKYALRLAPFIRSELVADALAVAVEARILDMRASPYDLAAVFATDNHLGVDPSPVAVETRGGRRQYARLQCEIAEKAAPVRRELIRAYDRFLRADDDDDDARSPEMGRLPRTIPGDETTTTTS